MNWQTIDMFPYPENEWDFSVPSYLLYSDESGIVVGTCLLTDAEDKVYLFQYDRECLRIKPTHWMPLPEAPK